MLCCVAVGFLVATFLRAYRRLTGRGPAPRAVFAPPARRPAPGTAAAREVVRPAPPPPAHEGAGRLPFGPVLRFAAAGVALYAVAVAGLVALGGADVRAGAGMWAARSAVLAVMVATLLVSAGTAPVPAAPPARRQAAGCALLGLGLAWLELGLLDLHLFGLFALAGGDGWETVFHGAGALAILAGWALARSPGGRALVPQRD